jgi:hypothetical protein
LLGPDGRRYLLHWNYEREGGTDLGTPCPGKISTPKILRVDENGRLRLEWFDGLDAYMGDHHFDGPPPALADALPSGVNGRWVIDDGRVAGERLDGLAICPLEEEGDDAIFEARIRLDAGRAAGLMVRGDGEGHGGYVVLLDAERHAVDLRELPYLDLVESKHLTGVGSGSTHALRVCAIQEFLEVYVDGELAIPATRYGYRRGAFGLVVEGARATFSDLRARPIGVGRSATAAPVPAGPTRR